jgi:hypothetical protein
MNANRASAQLDWTDPLPLQWWTPRPLSLDSELHIADVTGPVTAGERWRTVLDAHLYLIAGWSPEYALRAGYFGQSAAVSPGRAFDSLTQWAHTQQCLDVRRIALVRFSRAVRPALLRLIESRTIMALSASNLFLLNTHTSAGTAGSRLGRAARLEATRYANELAKHLLNDVLEGRTNTRPTPAPNTREAAVRIVLRAERALDTREVCDRLRGSGWTTQGRTPEFTVRRDLRARERATPGTPRVFTTMHRSRRVYWPPHLSKTAALRGYDAAHP